MVWHSRTKVSSRQYLGAAWPEEIDRPLSLPLGSLANSSVMTEDTDSGAVKVFLILWWNRKRLGGP